MSQSEITTANCPSLVSAPLETGAGGDRGGRRPFDYLEHPQNPCPCPGTFLSPKKPQAQHTRIYSIRTTFYCTGHRWIHACSGSLFLSAISEVGIEWSGFECPAAEKGGGKEMDTRTNLGETQIDSSSPEDRRERDGYSQTSLENSMFWMTPHLHCLYGMDFYWQLISCQK